MKTLKLTSRAQKILSSTNYNATQHPAIAALVAFAAQNPGLDYRNYGSASSYRSDSRSITAALKRFTEALEECDQLGVTDADVIAEAPHAFSGRLEWAQANRSVDENGVRFPAVSRWDYCTGQYFPTEYRNAAATLLEYAARSKRRSRPKEDKMPRTIEELKALNRENGGCWFEKSTMRFFGTWIQTGVIRGCYFITSEQPPHGRRAFTVRQFDSEGNVSTVGTLCGHATLQDARDAINAIPMEAKAA